MKISESIGVLEILSFAALALVVGLLVWSIFSSIKETRARYQCEHNAEMSLYAAIKHFVLEF